jgi:hypothetical protein
MKFYSLLECVELDYLKNIIFSLSSAPYTTSTFHTVTSNYSDKSPFITFPTYNVALMCGIVRYSVK